MAFGGSVKLTGESEYRQAIKNITKDLQGMSKSLKDQTADFNSNGKIMNAITGTQSKLTQSLKEQESQLSKAKSAYASYQTALTGQQAKHQSLTKEYKNAVNELERIRKESGETSDEYKKQEKVVDELGQELADSNKTMNETKSAMSGLKTEINNSEKTIDSTKQALDGLGNEAEDAGEQAKNGGDGFTVMKGVLANLASEAITSAINGMKQLGGAIINVGKQAYDNYSNYEQLVGGVETLFGESSEKLIQYADNAYKTSGLSANEYMEQATSFSATLLQGLGGDTEKAVEYADLAITDMSDNANKMGTDMSLIQNAYQGFAKDNYTMLDNLKLGYGGTQSEMARLINDSGVLGDSIEVTAESVKDVPFDQVIQAINVTQQRLGITGTTAKEASETLEGSAKTMQSAWQNLLTGMADDNANFDQLITNLVDSVVAVANNAIPRVQKIITGMGQMASQLIQTVVPQLVQMIPPLLSETLPLLIDSVTTMVSTVLEVIPQLMPVVTDGIMQIIQAIIEMLPQFLEAGIQIILGLASGITDAIPQLVAMLPEVINSIVNTLVDNLPQIIETGLELLVALIQGISDAIPQLIQMLPTIVGTIVATLIQNLPQIIKAGIQILVALINGIAKSIPQLIAMTPRLIVTIVTTLTQNLPKILSMGGQIIGSLIKGIGSMLGNLGSTAGQIVSTIAGQITQLPAKALQWGTDMINGLIKGIRNMIGAVGDAVSSVAEKITSFLHFSRPDEGPLREYEEWMPDMVEGLSNSLKKASPALINQTKALASGMSDALTVDGSINESYGGSTNGSGYNNIVNAFKEALSQMKIELDDDEVGSFVDKTVTRLVYS